MSSVSLLERLESDRPVLMDGAMSTELAGRGLVFNDREWLRINLDRPELVAEVHAAYAHAGAELHIANSFATARHVTEHYGFAESFKALNRAAVELCREAIDTAASHPQWIAGSISTYAPDHDRSKLPSLDRLETNCRAQALILAEAGCDMIVLEMVADAATGIVMLNGAAATALPISIGLICGRSKEGTLCLQHRTISPEPIARGLAKILYAAPQDTRLIVTIMHTDIADTPAALREVRGIWSGKLGAYPHTGQPDGVGGWDTSNSCSDVEFTQTCMDAIEQGACFVGGCCGVGPHYIRRLTQQIATR